MNNKNIEKNTHPTNNYRNWLIGILICLVIVLIAWLVVGYIQSKRNAEAEKFNASHFNSNVVIYNVPVGKLTVKKATAKINEKAKNSAVLKGDEVILKKNSDKVITNKKVQSYFEEQHTRYPSRKKWNFQNTELLKAKEKLNQIKDRQVKYTVNGKSFVFKRSEIFPTVTYENDKYVFSDTKILANKISSINKEVSTLHKSYDFQLPNGQVTKVKNESYGWAINEKKLVAAVENALVNNTQELNGKNYIYGEGFSTYGTGYGLSNNGIGNSYIVVSLTDQKLWIYKNGKCVVTLNTIVTGTVETKIAHKNLETPTGVWYIQYKESPSVLKGTNDDGSKYSVDVKYWMPFTLTGCGFHDNSWRKNWSKTAYLNDGSYGCVNLKPNDAPKVWNNIEKNEAVIIYK